MERKVICPHCNKENEPGTVICDCGEMLGSVVPVLVENRKDGLVYRKVAKDYAAERGLSEYQVINDIKTGKIDGVEENGHYFVRIIKNKPSRVIAEKNGVSKPATKVSVADYAKDNGLSIDLIMKEIADGSRNGYHENGIWYIGRKKPIYRTATAISKENKSTESEDDGCLSIISGLAALVVVIFIFKSCVFSDTDEQSFSRQNINNSGTAPSTSTIKSREELNCITRLVLERKEGQNTMTDSEIATLCDYLF